MFDCFLMMKKKTKRKNKRVIQYIEPLIVCIMLSGSLLLVAFDYFLMSRHGFLIPLWGITVLLFGWSFFVYYLFKNKKKRDLFLYELLAIQSFLVSFSAANHHQVEEGKPLLPLWLYIIATVVISIFMDYLFKKLTDK